METAVAGLTFTASSRPFILRQHVCYTLQQNDPPLQEQLLSISRVASSLSSCCMKPARVNLRNGFLNSRTRVILAALQNDGRPSAEGAPDDSPRPPGSNEDFRRELQTTVHAAEASSSTPAEDYTCFSQKVDVQIAPHVLKSLTGGGPEQQPAEGLSLIEKNRLKRQARLAAAAAAAAAVRSSNQDASLSSQHDTSSTAVSGESEGLEWLLQKNKSLTANPTTAEDEFSAKLQEPTLRSGLGQVRKPPLQEMPGPSRPGPKFSHSFPPDRADNEKQLLPGPQADEATARIMLEAKAMATIEAWRSQLPISLSEVFYGPDGKNVNGRGPQFETQLMHKLYFKNKFRRRDARMDEARLLREVFAGSLFATELSLPCRQGLIFYGDLKGDPDKAWEEIQARLDAQFPGLVAILGRDDVTRGAIGCLIAPAEDLLSFALPRPYFATVTLVLLAVTAVFTWQTVALDPFLSQSPSPTWLSLIAPLGLLAVLGAGVLARAAIASYHRSSEILDYPTILPIPLLGCFAPVVGYKGFLQNRAILLDLSLGSSMASLAVSATLIFLGFHPMENMSGPGVQVADYGGLVMVPANLLSHSTVLAKLANGLATAVFVGEHGELEMAMSPAAVAGLLGLHMTALSLLPIKILDGGRITTGIFGRNVQHLTSKLAIAAVGLSLFLHFRWLGVLWIGSMGLTRKDDWFQWNEVSDPGIARKVLGVALVCGATVAVLPFPWPL